jgi:opacity protein-like surface antigen
MKKIVICTLLAAMSGAASANWEIGVSYAQLKGEVASRDITLGAIVGHLGYHKQLSESVTLVPRVRFGVGISDDTWRAIVPGASDVDISLDRFLSLDAKFQFQASENVYLYVMPAYANAKLSASALGSSASDDNWEFGGGVGVGYSFSPKISVEASYEKFDGTDVLSIGFASRF